jgi:hypothetical protein
MMDDGCVCLQRLEYDTPDYAGDRSLPCTSQPLGPLSVRRIASSTNRRCDSLGGDSNYRAWSASLLLQPFHLLTIKTIMNL